MTQTAFIFPGQGAQLAGMGARVEVAADRGHQGAKVQGTAG